MKINRLDAHDRLIYLQKDQSDILAKGCQDCLKTNRDSLLMQERCPYVYIFAHPRTHDDGISKRLLWQPRLSKPKPQTNSYLFRAISHTDNVEICWLIPPREQWNQYRKGNVTESEIVEWSIHMFQFKREELEKPDSLDCTEEQFKMIMLDIALAIDEDNRMKKLYSKQATSAVSSISSPT